MRIICCLLLAAILPSWAAQEGGRAIRFRVLCFEFASPERELTVSGDPKLATKADVELSRRLDSKQYSITVAGGPVLLGKLATNPEGKPAIEPIAAAQLPAGGDEFLFLLVPSGRETGEIYRCLVLPDDTKDFPPGGFRLINMSSAKLRFAMGKERFELLSGTIKTLGEIAGAGQDGRFAYVAQYLDGEIWNRLSTGYWTRRDKIRSLQIVFVDPRTKRLVMRGYDDTLAIASEAVAGKK